MALFKGLSPKLSSKATQTCKTPTRMFVNPFLLITIKQMAMIAINSFKWIPKAAAKIISITKLQIKNKTIVVRDLLLRWGLAAAPRFLSKSKWNASDNKRFIALTVRRNLCNLHANQEFQNCHKILPRKSKKTQAVSNPIGKVIL